LNIKGYIKTSRDDEFNCDGIKYNYIHITVYNYDSKKYIDYIKSKTISMKDYIHYIYILPQKTENSKKIKNIKTSIHKVDKSMTFNDRENIYIKTLYHQELYKIWNIVKNISLHPEKYIIKGQMPTCGFLLYGKPGTGKSSLITRISKTLQRDIISFNKYSTCSLSYMYVCFKEYSYNNILLFDEIDIIIDNLIESEKNRNIKNKYILEEKRISYRNNNENIQVKNNKNMKNDNIINIKDSDNLTVKDLLSLFQGPSQVDGQMIFATTNNFEHIYKICPALFRTGRLTPINFNYIDKKSLYKLSNSYFDLNGMTYNQFETRCKFDTICNISTSDIITYAIELSSTNNFDLFLSHINKSV